MLAALLLAAVTVQLVGRVLGWPSLAVRVLPGVRGSSPFGWWALRLWLTFALPTVLALLLLGRVDALWRMPPEFAPVAALARSWGLFEAGPILLGLLLGVVLSTCLTRRRVRRGERPRYVGRSPRLPVTPGEFPAAALLAVSAGVTEELYFRLLLPLLVTIVTGSALAGVAVAALAFGAVHRYQGWIGMAATGLTGLFLSGVYLASGQLWLAMACHAVIDLNAVVIRPWLGRPPVTAR